MKVGIVGGGGREHAITHALARSPEVTGLAATPGNPGIAELASCDATVDLADPKDIAEWAIREQNDLVVVGPEKPLVAGAIDALEAEGILGFGPRQEQARLEGSKAYMKDLLRAAEVDTATYAVFGEEENPQKITEECYELFNGRVPVIKTDGLAGGKGVTLPGTWLEFTDLVRDYLSGRAFGEAGRTIVVEERLEGQEVSILVVCNGEEGVALEPAQDYKRLLDDDEGPNTGGMGSYSPVRSLPWGLVDEVMETMITPTLREFKKRGTPYQGVLYAGLMLTESGPKMLEYNIRLGDPETQVVLPRMKSSLAELLRQAAAGEELMEPEWTDEAAVTVTLASEGYPEDPRTGDVIIGLDSAANHKDVIIFHAGTAQDAGNRILTAGGRVLNVTGIGTNLSRASQRAYGAADKIVWPGIQSRADIGA